MRCIDYISRYFPAQARVGHQLPTYPGQKSAQIELEKHKDHLEAVLGVYQIGESPISEIGSYTLSRALETTRSRYGIIILPGKNSGEGYQRRDWGLSADTAVVHNLEEMVQSSIINATPCTRNDLFIGSGKDQEGYAGHRLAIPVIESGAVVTVLCPRRKSG